MSQRGAESVDSGIGPARPSSLTLLLFSFVRTEVSIKQQRETQYVSVCTHEGDTGEETPDSGLLAGPGGSQEVELHSGLSLEPCAAAALPRP